MEHTLRFRLLYFYFRIRNRILAIIIAFNEYVSFHPAYIFFCTLLSVCGVFLCVRIKCFICFYCVFCVWIPHYGYISGTRTKTRADTLPWLRSFTFIGLLIILYYVYAYFIYVDFLLLFIYLFCSILFIPICVPK